MTKPTCEQLIEQLGDKQDIIICSDVVYGLGFEYTQLKNKIDNALCLIDRTIEIIKQQPTKDDSFILSRLYGIKFALNGGDKE